MKNSTIKSSYPALLSILILLLIWGAISTGIGSEIILPSPEAVFKELIKIIQSADFLPTVFTTILRAFSAFLIACIFGIFAGILTGFSKFAYSLTRPLLIVIMSAPIISFILLALIWFKSDNVPIFATFLMTFPIITTNVREGIRNVDKGLIEMADIYRIRKWRVLSEIYLPSIASYLMAAVSTAVGLGWKVVVTSEVLSQPQFAIGTSLQNSKIYLETSGVFAWTLIAVTLSFIFEILIRTLEKGLFKWR